MIDKHIYEIKLYVLHRAESTYMKFIRYNCKYLHVCKKTCENYLRYLFLVVFHLFLLLSKFFVEFLSEFLEFDFPFLL